MKTISAKYEISNSLTLRHAWRQQRTEKVTDTFSLVACPLPDVTIACHCALCMCVCVVCQYRLRSKSSNCALFCVPKKSRRKKKNPTEEMTSKSGRKSII